MCVGVSKRVVSIAKKLFDKMDVKQKLKSQLLSLKCCVLFFSRDRPSDILVQTFMFLLRRLI